jgi:hypothetical protein
MGVAKTFPLRVAAAAAQSDERTLRRWLDNHVIELRGNDVTTTGSGTQCGWSRNRIVQAGTTEALLKSGMSLSRAAKASLKFSDEGQARRSPGDLFEHGNTILVIGPECATVKNVFYDATLAEVTNRGVCTITVDMNKIVQKVDEILNNESMK